MGSTPQTTPYTKVFKLNSGVEMPAVGLGTYRIRSSDVIRNTVDHALSAGYRMFDTAAVYGNEAHLGKAFKELLPKYGLVREDIFVITKLSPADHGDKAVVERAFNRSLQSLDLEYIDMYLMHFPGASKIPSHDTRNAHLRKHTWDAMSSLYDDGKVNAIGVSNFTIKHLQDLLAHNKCVPAINQVEWHPYYHQPELLTYCRQSDITLQAYCSFGGSSVHITNLLDDAVVRRVSKKLSVSPTQVLLAWALQQDISVIPKSTHPEHIKNNIHGLDFKIPDEDMTALGDLREVNTKYAWDPSAVA